MKRLRNVKDKRMEDVLRQNFQATACDSDLCDRCAEEWIQEDSHKVRSRLRSASPNLETRIEPGDAQETTYRNILNIRQEPTTKMDRLLKEAVGWDTGAATHDEDKLTKITWEDWEVMVLQLNDDKLGPVWRQTKGLDRRRSG